MLALMGSVSLNNLAFIFLMFISIFTKFDLFSIFFPAQIHRFSSGGI